MWFCHYQGKFINWLNIFYLPKHWLIALTGFFFHFSGIFDSPSIEGFDLKKWKYTFVINKTFYNLNLTTMNEIIKLRTIKPKVLKILTDNQEECKAEAPVTTRATFKLFELEALLQAIKNTKDYKEDGDRKHSVCITFVREMIGDSPLGYNTDDNPAHKKMLENVTTDKKYTQLIPIITGCECILDNNTIATQSFKYLRDKSGEDGVILFVRPGGEGTGLIPPPPTGNDDDFS